MALRNIDTKFYKEGFVRTLPMHLKGFYSFMLTDCEPDGIWTMDLHIASVYMEVDVTEEVFEAWFIKKGKAIDLGDGKYFLPEFIAMQYPKGLNEKNPSQTNIIARLKGLGLLADNLSVKGTKVDIKIECDASDLIKKIAQSMEDSGSVGSQQVVEEKPDQKPRVKKAAKEVVEPKEGDDISGMQKRIEEFADSLLPFVAEFGNEMVDDFFKYWTEPNKSKTKFKRELHATWEPKRRLETWRKNDKNWQKQQKAAATESDYDKAKNL